jgi:hypothetical protein
MTASRNPRPRPSTQLRLTTPREHPTEIAVVLIVLMLGTTAAVGVAATGTVDQAAALAPIPLLVWSIGLVLASSTVLAAVFIRDPLRSVTVELVGLVPFGLLLLGYGAIVAVNSGLITIGPWLWGLLGTAALVRAVQIRRALEQLRATLQQLGSDGHG